MDIRTGGLHTSEVISLLKEHHHDMLMHSPPESVHALDLSKLEQADITFFSVWQNQALAGCGALKALDKSHAEIKSMRTSKDFLRQGVAKLLLEHMLIQASARGYKKLSLETGTADAFKPAQKLYQQQGFTECLPFADYQEDPYSTFMSKDLG